MILGCVLTVPFHEPKGRSSSPARRRLQPRVPAGQRTARTERRALPRLTGSWPRSASNFGGRSSSHEPYVRKKAENIGVFADRLVWCVRGKRHNPLPKSGRRGFRNKFWSAADTPNTPNREGKSSQREHPHGRHQTIILPCVGANLPNGHKGTRVSSGYTARGGGRVRVSQVHGHNQFLSSEIFASHEPL